MQNLLTYNQCQQIIQFHRTHKHLQSVGSSTDYGGIKFQHIQTPWLRQLVGQVSLNLICEIYKTQGKVVYPEMIALNEWPIGGVQEPHLDTYSTVELDNDVVEEQPSREWTLILYLNENFRGGETYFPDQENYVHKPVAREGLLFQGLYHKHGVYPVRRNSRHTISMWFSTNPDNIITDNRTKDLELDHYRLRKA